MLVSQLQRVSFEKRILAELLEEKRRIGITASGTQFQSPLHMKRLGVNVAAAACNDPVNSGQIERQFGEHGFAGKPLESAGD